MIRSLGLVMILVVALWFFARPPASDSVVLRAVDPASDRAAFQAEHPGAPVPVTVPATWTTTVSDLTAGPSLLRIGFVTGDRRYVEYAAFVGGDDKTLPSLTGTEQPGTPVDVNGVSWSRVRQDDGSVSLVREVAGVTIVLGTLRSDAIDDDLRALATALTS